MLQQIRKCTSLDCKRQETADLVGLQRELLGLAQPVQDLHKQYGSDTLLLQTGAYVGHKGIERRTAVVAGWGRSSKTQPISQAWLCTTYLWRGHNSTTILPSAETLQECPSLGRV